MRLPVLPVLRKKKLYSRALSLHRRTDLSRSSKPIRGNDRNHEGHSQRRLPQTARSIHQRKRGTPNGLRNEKHRLTFVETIRKLDEKNFALSRLNSFLDSELEQLLCFDTAIDAEKFCREKCAIFIIMPEENPVTYFMISLMIQQLYREILAVADENGGQLKKSLLHLSFLTPGRTGGVLLIVLCL